MDEDLASTTKASQSGGNIDIRIPSRSRKIVSSPRPGSVVSRGAERWNREPRGRDGLFLHRAHGRLAGRKPHFSNRVALLDFITSRLAVRPARVIDT